jgi:DNA-binding NarL/FixJ family response regulator
MPAKFLIVEDHPIFAEALRSTLAAVISNVCFVHAGTLADAKDALEGDADFDLVLLDLWLPDTHGFAGLIELRKRFPKLPIVIISAFADQTVVHRSMVCGASGFIPKSARKESFQHAIHNVLAGEIVMPSDCLAPDSVANIELDVLTTKLQSLTHQQLRVLQMLCQGLLNKQIAHELDVGEATVKAHISEILRKLHVCSRTQAVLEVSKLDFGAVLALYMGHNGGSVLPEAHRVN